MENFKKIVLDERLKTIGVSGNREGTLTTCFGGQINSDRKNGHKLLQTNKKASMSVDVKSLSKILANSQYSDRLCVMIK